MAVCTVQFHGEAINFVNAEHLARQRGIKVMRSVLSDSPDYPSIWFMARWTGCFRSISRARPGMRWLVPGRKSSPVRQEPSPAASA